MKRILVLGAGGAAQGVIAALLQQAPSELVIANRTKDRALALADKLKLSGNIVAFGLTELEPTPYDFIINTTSAGLTGSSLELPTGILSEKTCCYDLMYGKQGTPFLDWAKALNADFCLDGLGMLVEQAALSFYLWHGVYPQTKAVIAMLRGESL